jgi:Flp pilus assembly protein TadD
MRQATLRPNSSKPTKPPTTLAGAHAHLAQAEKLRRAGNPDKAIGICESLLKEFPDYVGPLQTLGVIHLAKKNYWQALSCFTKAAMLCPRDSINLVNLAAVYLGLNSRELATITLDQARRLKPDDAEIYFHLGEIYREEREYELAVQAYEKALELEPKHALAAHGLGESLTHLGRYAEAALAHLKVHDLRPESVGCLYGLALLPPDLVSIDLMAALEKLRTSKRQADADFRIHLAYAFASVMDRERRYGESWGKLLEANQAEYSAHAIDYEKQLARQESSRKTATNLPVMTTRPPLLEGCPISVFLIGASRSGKTTLERLAGMLPNTKRGYESRLVERAVKRASQLSGLLTLSYPNDLPQSLDGEFRRFYLEELKDAVGAARIFTNTNPGMIHGVGRIAAALPNVRFVFVKRDPYDLALRIFGKKYKSGNHYAYNIKTIFDYVDWYYGMVDMWIEKLSPLCRVIHYEDMIGNPRKTLQTVAELCGASVPDGPLPVLGDDRGCAIPYRAMIDIARSVSG